MPPNNNDQPDLSQGAEFQQPTPPTGSAPVPQTNTAPQLSNPLPDGVPAQPAAPNPEPPIEGSTDPVGSDTSQVDAKRQLSFGEKAVGISFNPSRNSDVDHIKRLYAAVIDILNIKRMTAEDTGAVRHYSVAITDAETAQLRAVKALTWEPQNPAGGDNAAQA